MLSTYLKSYLTYKDKYVYVYKEGLIFGDRNKVTGVQHGDIDMIIEARHKHRIKLYRIIHVFLKDGRYFYFTTDIAKYKAFKVMLREHYESCYYVREHLFPEGVEATKENLMDETI
ncbi:MAG: hypothetical protein JXO44_05565 [Clostridia bacterium]|nr:hypothetical protein [Clostridia bacterium]